MTQLSTSDQRRVDAAIRRVHEIGFVPEPEVDVARRLLATRDAAACSAIESNPLTPLELELQTQLIRRGVPADVLIQVLHEDAQAHPLPHKPTAVDAA